MGQTHETSSQSRFYRRHSMHTSYHDSPLTIKKSIETVLGIHGLDSVVALSQIIENWEEAVGSRISTHAKPVKIENSELIVGVDHPAWATEVRALSTRILSQLNRDEKSPGIQRLKVYVRRPGDLE